MSPRPVILWFRRDLRLGDNMALHQAIATGAPILPLYILDESHGAASRWWLHMSLENLGRRIAARGGQLILRRGKPENIITELAKKTQATAVFWNRIYDPQAEEQERQIAITLTTAGLKAHHFKGALLCEPGEIVTGAGKPYAVFTPFWKACLAKINPTPALPAPSKINSLSGLSSDRLEDWGLRPTVPDWAGGLSQSWQPGEDGAHSLLDLFAQEKAAGYNGNRDFPARPSTSQLSPHLHFGEISPRQIWHRIQQDMATDPGGDTSRMAFLRQLCWREFCHGLLKSHPDLPHQNLKREFDAFPWASDPKGLKAWQKGRTGYPIVDAGMRELWQTGWMHNRVRMIAASFLIKDLLIDWRAGEKWFWDTLVDADLANNAAGWQWVAGSGADASPFFRVFNPTLQGQKFDPEGDYIRRWIPELSNLPNRYIHTPWEAPAHMQTGAAKSYPRPIINHAFARNRALAAYKSIKY